MKHRVFRTVQAAGMAVLLSAAVASFPTPASAETWTVTSLAWQPFSGPDLPDGGAGIKALRKVLAKAGIELEVKFMPWRRAKRMAQSNPDVVGYYPSWPEEVVDGFFASRPVFRSPLGFAQRTADPVAWDNLDDLSGYRMAVVGAYIYPPEFQAKVDDRSIPAVTADNDAIALRLLGAKRVDGFAVDKFVMQYQLQSNDDLSGIAGNIGFNEKILGEKDLVIAFAEGDGNEARAERLADLLAKADAQATVDAYLAGLR